MTTTADYRLLPVFVAFAKISRAVGSSYEVPPHVINEIYYIGAHDKGLWTMLMHSLPRGLSDLTGPKWHLDCSPETTLRELKQLQAAFNPRAYADKMHRPTLQALALWGYSFENRFCIEEINDECLVKILAALEDARNNDPSSLEWKRAGRPKKVTVNRVVFLIAQQYHAITEQIPTVTVKRDTGHGFPVSGSYVDLVAEIFSQLGITASVEAMAKSGIAALKKSLLRQP